MIHTDMIHADMIDALANLHFLRPYWLWALLALPLLAWGWRARQRRASVWGEFVDPHLLPHLLQGKAEVRGQGALWRLLLGAILAILALAGPAWRQWELPPWQTRAPLVVALDLSSATTATDLPPSRLLQARATLATLLRERAGGQVGLVAFAEDAYTVAPLTDDTANIALFLDALAPEVMPVDGQRVDRAIAHAARLLRQAGFERGDILVLSDHADAAARSAAATAARDGYRVSALGLGRASGAAYRDHAGRIARTRLDAGSLQALADAGGGRYAAVTAEATDLRALALLEPARADAASARGETGKHWQDAGYWLLPPLLLLALFAFRRGGAVAVVLLLLGAPLASTPAQAQTQAPQASLWRRADQAEHARMQDGIAAYRRSDFAGAAQAWQGLANADAHYNRGNALAKAGRYDDAIAAYDRALRLDPKMDDALANKRAVEAAKRRKPAQGQQQNQQQNQQQGQAGQQGSDGQPKQPSQQQPSPGEQPSPSAPQRERPPQPPSSSPKSGGAKPAQAGDASTQRAADAAQRARMQQALEASKRQPPAPTPMQAQARNETTAERERRLANEAWLRRIPDEPGGLLRAKFQLEHERRQREGRP